MDKRRCSGFINSSIAFASLFNNSYAEIRVIEIP